MATSVEMEPKPKSADARESEMEPNELGEQMKLNSQQETQASGNNANAEQRESNNTMIKTLVSLLIAYSVIVSTIALIIALDASSASSSCDCSLKGLAQESELTATNGVGDSGFCKIVDFCAVLEATNNPTMSPSKYPTRNPSVGPTKNPSSNPSINPSSNPSINPSQNPSINPTKNPSSDPSMSPSSNPSIGPTQNPSSTPSQNPSSNPSVSPTSQPTVEPTMEPTKSPTYFDGYFVGDFKFSLQNDDHGFWKLCNGSLLEIYGEYSSLFNVIGYKFGSYNDTMANKMYFKLPNPANSAVGIAGDNHLIGDTVGTETITLSQNQLPSHRHYVMHWKEGTIPPGPTNNTLALSCDDYGVDYWYSACESGGTANTFLSSPVGSGGIINIMQPTTFISNLFIYTAIPQWKK